jgi:hypothetical protein
MSVVTDVVARRFMAPRFKRILDPHVLTGPQCIERLIGYLRKVPRGFGAHVCSVDLDEAASWSRRALRLILPAGVLAEPRAYERLNVADSGCIGCMARGRHDERLYYEPSQRVGYADHRGRLDGWMPH